MSIIEGAPTPARRGGRRRETRPERIIVGNKTMERNDITAKKYSESERTLNRGDAKGAPFILIGGVKYRPQPDFDNFILSGIQTRKPPRRRVG